LRSNLSKRFGGFVALDSIDPAVASGARVMIGPNGSGKSTLVNCLCGTLVNETGEVRFAGRDAPISARGSALPAAFMCAAVRQHDAIADNLRIPLLYAVTPQRKPALTEAEIGERRAELLTVVGLADRALYFPKNEPWRWSPSSPPLPRLALSHEGQRRAAPAIRCASPGPFDKGRALPQLIVRGSHRDGH
jgi:ABC-type multidrug transport system ATPase subunit